jgi:hypothetical protein
MTNSKEKTAMVIISKIINQFSGCPAMAVLITCMIRPPFCYTAHDKTENGQANPGHQEDGNPIGD